MQPAQGQRPPTGSARNAQPGAAPSMRICHARPYFVSDQPYRLDYSLKRWGAWGRFLTDGAVSVDNNHIENQMRPWAMGRKAWLFAGSEMAGKRAAMVMSLVQSAKLHGYDPWAYRKDVLQRLQAHPNHRIGKLCCRTGGCPARSHVKTVRLVAYGATRTMCTN